MKKKNGRGLLGYAEKLLEEKFGKVKKQNKSYDVVFTDTSYRNIIAIGPFENNVPAMKELFANDKVSSLLEELDGNNSYLIEIKYEENLVQLNINNRGIFSIEHVKDDIGNIILEICKESSNWAGMINELGEHIVDLKSPSPGPHFNTNLLLGDRSLYENPLQTTPKSVVDKFGRGGFRSHAATQVLANRWDMLQEENGFPANRQFYIIEEGKQIFYSANPFNNVEDAKCIHGQNYTKIIYTTNCSLEIERLIFILPYKAGMPIATEIQNIKIKNNSDKERKLKLIYTGMFGTAAPGALMEDVLYSNVIMEARLLNDETGAIKAYIPYYYPNHSASDVRFESIVVDNGDEVYYPREICTNYSEFVGSGSLDNPVGINKFTNKLNTKGPGFFAIASKLNISTNNEVNINSFTGCISSFNGNRVQEESIETEISKLLDCYNSNKRVMEAYAEVCDYYSKYRNYLKVKTDNSNFDTYVNNNLPFQVLYQTFVSRSFDQTQKGYREIGFREIQDVFASMYYFVSSGRAVFVKDLIKEWANKVFQMGYCYHNFFWKGKEPGKWSDDGLWLLQAVNRYVNLTEDYDFLYEEVEVAGTDPVEYRTLYETMKSIVNYSAVISVGNHGIPLIDFADWNDCLKVDNDYITGPEKEKLYKKLIEKNQSYNGPLESDGSESVMNGFLLKIAIDSLTELIS